MSELQMILSQENVSSTFNHIQIMKDYCNCEKQTATPQGRETLTIT